MAWGGSNFDGRMRIWLLLIVVIVSFPALTDPSVLLGTVTKVRDGDTIEVGRILIRLNGVYTPEMNEPLGPKSKAFMTDLFMGKRLRCELDGTKKHTLGLLASTIWTGRTSVLRTLLMDWRWTARGLVAGDMLSMKLRER